MNDFFNLVFDVPENEIENIFYNNISVIKVGDFMQLNMVGTPIYGVHKNDSYNYFRPNIWKENFLCFELTECMRQKGDDDFIRILNKARYMTVESDWNKLGNWDKLPDSEKEVITFLYSRNIESNHPDYPHHALHVFPLNKDVKAHNDEMIKNVNETFMFKAVDSKKDMTGSFKPLDIIKDAKDDSGLPDKVKLGVGAVVMITKNEDVEDRIVNGTTGTIVGFEGVEKDDITKENGRWCHTIWVRPDDSTTGLLKRQNLTKKQKERFPNCIPIKRKEDYISIANDNTSYKRIQFPLKLCYGATIHKYQGRSKDTLVVGGFEKMRYWKPGMLYTALTRCRRADGLYLLGFNPVALNANDDGKKEIERIRKESMITELHPRITFFEMYPKSNWEFICLQNVRSVAMHKLDILSDSIMMGSSVICLTETALSCDDWNGWKDFENFEIYQKCRKDAHEDPNINQRKSGGVALLVNKEIKSSSYPSDEIDNLEKISAKVSILNELLSISLIYKDHKMPKKEFLQSLDKLFKKRKDMPSMILGDFNIDTLKDNDLVSLVKKHKFVPLVENGTTINGNPLDQIYVCNFPILDKCEVVTVPSYFLDHDLVVLCLPKEGRE